MSRDSDDDVRSRANEVRGSGDGSDGKSADSDGKSADSDGNSPDGESEWRFAVDDVGPDGVTEDTSTPATEPIEPESIELEHAVFVVLGVALTVGVLLFGF